MYQDFTSVTGLAVTPTVTPYITGSYGIFTPQDTPIVGELSIFDISLGYDNPLAATFCVGTCPDQGPNEDTTITGNPGILVDSAGFLVPHAGILDSITQLLTWDGRIQVYDAQKCLVGTCIKDATGGSDDGVSDPASPAIIVSDITAADRAEDPSMVA